MCGQTYFRTRDSVMSTDNQIVCVTFRHLPTELAEIASAMRDSSAEQAFRPLQIRLYIKDLKDASDMLAMRDNGGHIL